MNASNMQREDVEEFVRSDEGKTRLQELDKRWGEVMDLAKECGFIIQAYGGTCTLATYAAMESEVGVSGVVRMLQMNAIELPDNVRVND